MTKRALRPAVCTMECVDVWPPGTLDAVRKCAYDRLAALGTIRPLRIHSDPRTGITAVRYLSAIPQEWTKDALAALCREGMQIHA